MMGKHFRLLFYCLYIGLLCPVMLTAQADPGEIRLTIDAASVPLSEVLNEITAQSGMHFSFNPRLVHVDEIVTFTCRDFLVSDALTQLCGQVYLEYALVEGQIVLTPVESSLLPVYMLTGYVTDSTSAENLISATIAVDDGVQGTSTNDFGYYAIPLRRGRHQVYFSYLGYRSVMYVVDIRGHISQNVKLTPTAAALPEIEIYPVGQNAIQDDLGQITLRPEDLNKLPELASETGLVRNLQHLAGVKQHSEVSAFFYVRGGERDQNIIYIDDAPIYNPSHLLGLSSMIIPDFAQQITVYKSDMPASMGDRLSSIVSIRTRDGNLNKFHMSGSISPFVNRLSFEIPLVKERSSLFVSYRRSAFEKYYRRDNADFDFYFQDFHLKWNYRASDRNRFFITIIGSGDKLGTRQEVTGIQWGNFAATFRWNHTFGPRLFSNTTLYTGNYAYNINLPPNSWKSDLGTLSLKSDFTHYISNNLTSKFGLEVQGYFTTPGQLTLATSIPTLPNIQRNYGRKSVLYYQADAQLSQKLKLHAGLRLINWENTGPTTYYRYNEAYQPVETINAPEGVYQTYLNADPRISIEYQPTSDQKLKFSYGMYHQYLQLISNSISPFTAMELWLTAGPNIRPQKSMQWSLDYARRWKDNTTLSASAYYKSSDNQIDLHGHATIYLNEHLEGELRFGSSEAYGVEAALERSFGKLDASLAYTWSRVFRTTPDLNQGLRYPAFQDRPHDLSLSAVYHTSDRFSLTGYWASSSGSPFTSPTGFYTYNGQTVPVYGERHNDRLPAYHRLDISANWRLNRNLENKYQHSLTFSLFNMIGYPNVYAVKFNKLYSEDLFPDTPSNVYSDQSLSPSRTELIQVFPSLTYKFSL